MRMLRWTIAVCILVPALALAAPYDRHARTHHRPKAFDGSEPTIAQISPSIRRARQPWLGRFRQRRRPSLADALLQPPDADTTPVLRDAGVPVVPGVPPIVILQPHADRDRDRDRAIRAQQQP